MDEQKDFVLDEEVMKIIKQHFFKESINLENMRMEIEEERRKFEREKREFESVMDAKESMYQLSRNQLLRERKTFDQQLNVLKVELRKLANEKEQLKKDRAAFESVKNKFSYFSTSDSRAIQSIFFKGLTSPDKIRQRYKDLTKIFHPDNMNGDDEMMKMINLEYDNIKKD
ncbi:MAG: hypothetical protein E7242_05160 [Lachnospiraceae bacterium]|nr:hypothetical protein [Lachnospiraceae bacterium]MCR5082698.1 hypothetical protein [Parasporobacterium sp.]